MPPTHDLLDQELDEMFALVKIVVEFAQDFPRWPGRLLKKIHLSRGVQISGTTMEAAIRTAASCLVPVDEFEAEWAEPIQDGR